MWECIKLPTAAITNYHQSSSSKQHKFTISQFWRSGVHTIKLVWFLCSESQKTKIKVSVSYDQAALGRICYKCIPVLAKPSPLACRTETPVFWLSAEPPSAKGFSLVSTQVLPHLSSSKGSLNSSHAQNFSTLPFHSIFIASSWRRFSALMGSHDQTGSCYGLNICTPSPSNSYVET